MIWMEINGVPGRTRTFDLPILSLGLVVLKSQYILILYPNSKITPPLKPQLHKDFQNISPAQLQAHTQKKNLYFITLNL